MALTYVLLIYNCPPTRDLQVPTGHLSYNTRLIPLAGSVITIEPGFYVPLEMGHVRVSGHWASEKCGAPPNSGTESPDQLEVASEEPDSEPGVGGNYGHVQVLQDSGWHRRLSSFRGIGIRIEDDVVVPFFSIAYAHYT